MKKYDCHRLPVFCNPPEWRLLKIVLQVGSVSFVSSRNSEQVLASFVLYKSIYDVVSCSAIVDIMISR